jgi:hypothetical protein
MSDPVIRLTASEGERELPLRKPRSSFRSGEYGGFFVDDTDLEATQYVDENGNQTPVDFVKGKAWVGTYIPSAVSTQTCQMLDQVVARWTYKFGVSEIHTTDLLQGRAPYNSNGSTRDERVECVRQLVDVVTRNDLTLIVGYTYDTEEARKNPYFKSKFVGGGLSAVALERCLFHAGKHIEEKGEQAVLLIDRIRGKGSYKQGKLYTSESLNKAFVGQQLAVAEFASPEMQLADCVTFAFRRMHHSLNSTTMNEDSAYFLQEFRRLVPHLKGDGGNARADFQRTRDGRVSVTPISETPTEPGK